VHAHPDDETINNGATMAMYAAQGTQVTLVTCTLGEEGEVLVPSSRTSPPTATTASACTASASSRPRWRRSVSPTRASSAAPAATATRG
jgi:N-acetyl-1-D-myo-inositol-2-amino-2-deoxy-alpha-D-glucopyranoside deacetylase